MDMPYIVPHSLEKDCVMQAKSRIDMPDSSDILDPFSLQGAQRYERSAPTYLLDGLLPLPFDSPFLPSDFPLKLRHTVAPYRFPKFLPSWR